jgi:hypothetical protein
MRYNCFTRPFATLTPEAQELYVIQDCWPVYFLPEVCQTTISLGLTLVALPTYSSWRNPIQKVWRLLKQEVLHMHVWANDWLRLTAQVPAFLDRFSVPHTL